jgi:hypothetical protein
MEDYRALLDVYHRQLAALMPGQDVPEKPEKPEIRPWRGEPVWCGKCQARIRRQLAELDDLGALLMAARDGLREIANGDGPGRVTGTAVEPSPSEGLDDLDEMVSALTAWEAEYRDIRGWPSPPRRGFLASALTSCTAWLGLHLDGILSTDLAQEFGEDIGRRHRTLANKTKAGTGAHRKPVRCPRCGMMLLTWREGDDYVSCGNPDCGRMLSLDEYQEHAASEARHTAA